MEDYFAYPDKIGAVITTYHWQKKYSPPSLFEYLISSIIIALFILKKNHLFQSHLIVILHLHLMSMMIREGAMLMLQQTGMIIELMLQWGIFVIIIKKS